LGFLLNQLNQGAQGIELPGLRPSPFAWRDAYPPSKSTLLYPHSGVFVAQPPLSSAPVGQSDCSKDGPAAYESICAVSYLDRHALLQLRMKRFYSLPYIGIEAYSSSSPQDVRRFLLPVFRLSTPARPFRSLLKICRCTHRSPFVCGWPISSSRLSPFFCFTSGMEAACSRLILISCRPPHRPVVPMKMHRLITPPLSINSP